jgi:hypothetical protein
VNHHTHAERKLAILLVNYETASACGKSALSAFTICHKLRPLLESLMGVAGYLALVTRALARAQKKASELRGIMINSAGDLEPLPEKVSIISSIPNAEANVVIITELLCLMNAFIGLNLLLQLVRELWPTLEIYESNYDAAEWADVQTR